MKEQIHKRLSVEFVEEVMEGFNSKRLTEEIACELLGIKRARLYKLRKRWLMVKMSGEEFKLWDRKENRFHKFPEEVEEWLHQEMNYIVNRADKFRGKFNFAFLAEMAEREFARVFHRNSIRLFALRHGYYHGLPGEKEKVWTRFETSGPGVLFQHDTSYHIWIPILGYRHPLLLTEDDYTRKVVGARIVENESSYEHLSLVREVIEVYGVPLAYYVDNHSIFRYVEHSSRYFRYNDIDEAGVQFKRALNSVGIGVIYTGRGKAESKGKVEKRFDYLQRRLPYLCEKRKVKTIIEAQLELNELVQYYNDCRVHEETGEIPSKRWEKAEREGKAKLKKLDPKINLDRIFSLHYERRIKKDGTLLFRGKEYKVGRYPGDRVTVCFIPDKKLMVYKGENKICEFHL